MLQTPNRLLFKTTPLALLAAPVAVLPLAPKPVPHLGVERLAPSSAPPHAPLHGERGLHGRDRVRACRADAARHAPLELETAGAVLRLQLAAIAVEATEVRRPAATLGLKLLKVACAPCQGSTVEARLVPGFCRAMRRGCART